MALEEFMTALDQLFLETFGLGYEDFPDYLWYDCWANGMTPTQAFDDFRKDNERTI